MLAYYAVQVGLHIFCDVPGIKGCFGWFNIIHCLPGNRAEAGQTPAYVQMASYSYFAPHGSPVLSHSHLEAFSATLVVLWLALLLLLLLTFDVKRTEDSGQRSGRKFPASNLYWVTLCSPSCLLTSTDQSIIFGERPLKGLFQGGGHNVISDMWTWSTKRLSKIWTYSG